MSAAERILISLADLNALAVRALVAARTSPANARAVAAALVAAEADGIPSHGLSRLPAYADQAISGKVDGLAVPEAAFSAPAVLRVDAKAGFAYPALALGLDKGVPRTRETGMLAIAIRGSHHFGVAGHVAERAANQGLIALVLGNTPAAMAAWGGRRPLFGTNPLAFACPRAAAPPLVVDLALSKVARGKIMIKAGADESIPEGWALDRDGRPTSDAKAALLGSLLPIGDAKGSALALMVEVLAGALVGANFGFEASSFFVADGPPPRVGQLLILFDPACFSGESFAVRLEMLLSAMAEEAGVRIPGARRFEVRARAERQGITLPAALHRDLVNRAEAVL